MSDTMMKICTRLAVIAMVSFGASACSSIPDWVDPTTWVGGGPSDTEQAAGETPDLATLPDRPTPTSTAAEQAEVSQSLDADRARAKYSADALRGGTEAAAAPPPPPSAPSQEQIAAARAPAPPPPAPAPAAATSPDANTATVPQGNDAAPAAAAPAQEAAPLPPAPAPAINTPPPTTQSDMSMTPAAPAYSAPPSTPPSTRTMTASVDPSDAALGFRPSAAPPLDPSISQFVPAPIISRYQQTASAAGMPRSQIASMSPAPAPRHIAHVKAVGGPESMGGSVVANMDALESSAPVEPQASVYANPMGLPPTSVVYFPGDGTLLNTQARAQVRAAVQAFKQKGGQGYIRVIGHASSRTSNMPLEKHLVVIFDKSQDRANAVAKECIREGVPANRVLVEAVGDSQPVYYESMPKGEDGNRRAEIFLQS
jgi:outer membrane protein OmpA-like peptidoglycan-associated protein